MRCNSLKHWEQGTTLSPWATIHTVRYEVPGSVPVVLTSIGIPWDEVEDLLPESAAYRQDGFGVEELHGQSRDHSDALRSTRSPENRGRNAGALRA
jgi:hypothetical protein